MVCIARKIQSTPLSASYFKLTVHVDVLAQFNQLHLSWHVAHSSHQVPEVFAGDQPIFILIELFEGFTQLCREMRQNTNFLIILYCFPQCSDAQFPL